MEFKAYKMDGLGNDFVIIDRREDDVNLKKHSVLTMDKWKTGGGTFTYKFLNKVFLKKPLKTFTE